MRTELFDYELPEELIASRPLAERDAGRLLEVREDGVCHRMVIDLPALVRAGDLVVLNETRVRRARLECHRPSLREGGGGKVELLFLGQREEPRREGTRGEAELWEALGRANRPLRPGDVLDSPAGRLIVGGCDEQGVLQIWAPEGLEQTLAQAGQMPIPPYMRREADEQDVSRYQTVFARQLGSAAAPTAGLHLTDELLRQLEQVGARLARLTLHVGIGTFRPVKSDDLDDHVMHHEWIDVDESLASEIAHVRETGGRVVAIGTTVVRALESAADPERFGLVVPQQRETNLLIQPGYRFRVVDALLTNFHMPKSTLLALVSALGGRDRVMAAYRSAVQERYRFLSYGDAMWLPRIGTDPS